MVRLRLLVGFAVPVSDRRLGDFGVAVGFDTGRAVVGVRGDVDLLTAPTFAALVDALVDQGHSSLVFDLAELTFMGAAGIGVIAGISARLAASRGAQGAVTVRSAPAFTLRMLDFCGVDALVRIEASSPDDALLGAEQRPGYHSSTVNGGTADLAGTGSIPASNEVIDDALRLVTDLASATLEGADGVSVSLERHDRLITVGASNDTVVRMDDHQYETGEGPCVEAASVGHWFHIESLAQESRWPAFVPLAMEEGIASILSNLLMTLDRPFGALNIYSNTERAFGTHQQELAALFATQASGIVAGADGIAEQMGERINVALSAREVVAQAQGVLMAREGVTADAAATMLHRAAREATIPVRRHAAEVVASTASPGGPNR